MSVLVCHVGMVALVSQLVPTRTDAYAVKDIQEHSAREVSYYQQRFVYYDAMNYHRASVSFFPRNLSFVTSDCQYNFAVLILAVFPEVRELSGSNSDIQGYSMSLLLVP